MDIGLWRWEKVDFFTTKPPPITNKALATSCKCNKLKSISAPIKPKRAGCRSIHNESKISLTGFCKISCSRSEIEKKIGLTRKKYQ